MSRIPSNGGALEPLNGGYYDIALDESHIYISGWDGSVQVRSKRVDDQRVILKEKDGIRALATDRDCLYFSTSNELWKMPLVR